MQAFFHIIGWTVAILLTVKEVRDTLAERKRNEIH